MDGAPDEGPERCPRSAPVAHPRARTGLHRRGRLGPPDPRGCRRLPDPARCLREPRLPSSTSLPTRVLWGIRDLLGRWFDLGRIDGTADSTARLPIPGTSETSLAARLPDDLRGTTDTDLGSPFTTLYRSDDEYAAELSNRTVHAVLHLAWVEQGDGRYHGQMAVYVKPRGRFGQAYMTFIKPFRYLIVYPALMRHVERAWTERVARQRAAVTG